MSRPFPFGSRATWASVIGWVLTLPVLAWAVTIVLLACSSLPTFEEIFVTAGIPIPPMTRFLLDVGWVGVAAAFGSVALFPLVVLLRRPRPRFRVLAPLAGVTGTWALNAIFFHALLSPLRALLERPA